MTREANAAVEGALAAGATEIVVRDSHGTALNLLPEMLDRHAKLLRDWSEGPMYMMEGIDAAALNLHPEVARERIREGVERALRSLGDYKPYRLAPPYTLQLTLKTEQNIYRAVALYPGARRTGDWQVTYQSDDVMQIIRAYVGMRR